MSAHIALLVLATTTLVCATDKKSDGAKDLVDKDITERIHPVSQSIINTVSKNTANKQMTGPEGSAVDWMNDAGDNARSSGKAVISAEGQMGKVIGHCANLRKKNLQSRTVLIFSEERNVSVLWGWHAPSRAAAALLAAVLRHRLGYRRVHLAPGEASLCDLARRLPRLDSDNRHYDELIVHMGAEWDGSQSAEQNCLEVECKQLEMCSADVPRLQVVGKAASVSLRLHVLLSATARADSTCANAHAWPFYANISALRDCRFLLDDDDNNGIILEDSDLRSSECSTASPCVLVLVSTDQPAAYMTTKFLLERAASAGLRLRVMTLEDDASLHIHLRRDNVSFLFLDHDWWANNLAATSHVQPVQPPPCADPFACHSHLDPTTALRVADTSLFRQFAPPIHDVISKFSPRSSELRDIIDLETAGDGLAPEEAACAWASKNEARFQSWTAIDDLPFWALILFCDDDPNPNYYLDITKGIVGEWISKKIKKMKLNIYEEKIDCRATNIDLDKYTLEISWGRLIGLVTAGEGTRVVTEAAHKKETRVVLYDVPSDKTQLGPALWAAGGRVPLLARAIRHFLQQQGWHRLAIISDTSTVAKDFTAALTSDSTLAGRNRQLKSINNSSVKDTLKHFTDAGARIFFINTGPADAGEILCAAESQGMSRDAGYAWVVREWREPAAWCSTDNMNVFMISYWWRGGDDHGKLGSHTDLYKAISKKLSDERSWPTFVVPLTDALLLLVHGAFAALQRFPDLRYDLHGKDSASKVTQSFMRTEVELGVIQPLILNNYSRADPHVFVHAWNDSTPVLLAVWKFNDPSELGTNNMHFIQKVFEDGPPHDGTISCATITSNSPDAFERRCHDLELFVSPAILVLTLLVLLAARRARLAQMKRRERDIQVRLMARCEHTAAALAEYLVDRSALQLFEELGAGHFGCVFRGQLRLKDGTLMNVAVKSLRADAGPGEEAEFLREACALAALRHAHVARLRGVCAADGPPLLLMEHAFFGDLRRYLRERRHLAELAQAAGWHQSEATREGHEAGCKLEEAGWERDEARHVAPRALTRLAREAAAALAAVARARLVHRDVRAANCLVDRNRTLKLADFGMVRSTSRSADAAHGRDDYAYVCRRRGLFPVPWMAPESVRRGEFSAASDVWALGVLVLELVTLGARPFGAWPPARVLAHVRAGAAPALPLDVSYHTREVLEMCWAAAPGARATAAALERHLRAHAAALRPAWRGGADSPLDGPDSGFGERRPVCRLPSLLHSSVPHISTL